MLNWHDPEYKCKTSALAFVLVLEVDGSYTFGLGLDIHDMLFLQQLHALYFEASTQLICSDMLWYLRSLKCAPLRAYTPDLCLTSSTYVPLSTVSARSHTTACRRLYFIPLSCSLLTTYAAAGAVLHLTQGTAFLHLPLVSGLTPFLPK